jgi:hypothetical protein
MAAEEAGKAADFTIGHLSGQVVGMRKDIDRLYRHTEGIPKAITDAVHSAVTERLDSHEERISALERNKAWLWGGGSLIVFTVPLIVTLVIVNWK